MHDFHPITTQLLTFFLGAATIHGFYLSILLFLKNGKELPKCFLALALFCISFYLLNYLLFLTGIIRSLPNLLGAFSALTYMVGPAFYFFIKSSLQPRLKWQPIFMVHLLPIIYGGWKSINIMKMGVENKLAYIEKVFGSDHGDATWTGFIWGNFHIYILMGYVMASWLLCKKTKQQAADVSTLGKINWLQNFCLGFFLLLIGDLLIKFSGFYFDMPAAALEYILAALIALTIHVAGYFALGTLPKIKATNGKYKTSSLNEQQIKNHQNKLLQILEIEKPWLNADLKIADLAKLLDIPSHQLSQILNEGMKTNFFDLMNQYRIEEVKRRLLHPVYSHYSILAIALDCGFNNKTTFNRVFKKMTGMTPSGFVNSVH